MLDVVVRKYGQTLLDKGGICANIMQFLWLCTTLFVFRHIHVLGRILVLVEPKPGSTHFNQGFLSNLLNHKLQDSQKKGAIGMCVGCVSWVLECRAEIIPQQFLVYFGSLKKTTLSLLQQFLSPCCMHNTLNRTQGEFSYILLLCHRGLACNIRRMPIL